MRTLFWKIFAWFGTAQLLIAVSLYLLASATQRGFDRGLVRAAGASLEARARASAVAYEAGGITALRAAWRTSSPRRGGRRFRQGRDNSIEEQPVFGEPPPPREDELPGADGPREGERPPFSSLPDFSPDGPENRRGASLYVWSANAPKLLVGPNVAPQARATLSTAFAIGRALYDAGNEASPSFLARRITTASGAHYVAIQPMNIRGRGFGPLGEWLRPDSLMLTRFGIVGLLMGALCFGLARYLSAPARKLRTATHQFAEGDLKTRVGPQMGKRRDELADLGRDFDAMAERIEELITSQGRLLSDISHELRSPLARLNVAVELAEDSADESTRHYLDRIKEESAELDTLIGQLLTLQRLESRETSILKTSLDLAGLVTHVAEDVNFEARARGVQVEVKHLDPCELEGNPALLRSALQNIARNAVLHSGQARVHVFLVKQDGEAIIRVRDFGPGVPPESLAKLFDPFYRVGTDRARQSGGTGLGLSITKRAVEAHDGTVQASNAEGGGLEVEICLPLTKPE